MSGKMKNVRLLLGASDGIALIVVLGLLSVLLILAVAFSASMRTERVATRHFMDGVRARHLVNTALFRTLGDHITTDMIGRVYPDWVDPHEMLPQDFGNPEIFLLGDGTANSPIRFVPMSVRPADWDPQVRRDYGGVVWQELRDGDPNNDEFYGEYAYLVVNNTGLLDANVIGARDSGTRPLRRRGFSPEEIIFYDPLPPPNEPNSVLREAATSTLHDFRLEFRRFESVPELHYLASTTVFGDVGSPPLRQLGNTRANSYMADHLHVFSRFPSGYGVLQPDGEWNAEEQVFIGGDPAGWDEDAIDAAIEDVIEDPAQRQMFIRALYDYADEGLVPSRADDQDDDDRFKRFSAKPVPMINEVVVSNSLQLVPLPEDGLGETLTHRVYISVETAFLFPENLDNSAFSVELENLQITVFPPYFQDVPSADPDPVSFVPDPSQHPYNVTRFVIEQSRTVNVPGEPPPYPTPGAIQPFSVTVNFDQIRILYAGNPVDVVFGPWPATAFELPGDQPDLSGGDPSGTGDNGAHLVAAMSANDPRINWDPNNNLHWRSVAPTLGDDGQGARNDPRIDAERGQYGYNDDETHLMYARRGQIESVGEIGYLLYDPTRPWTTVPLLEGGTGVSALIDRFTVHTNRIRRGLANINSRQANALMAALWQAPIEQYPTAAIPEMSIVTEDMARQLADELITQTTVNGSMANLSEIGLAWTPASLDGILGTDNKFARESVLRNSLGLLGTRSNLFTIFLAARVFVDAYDPDNQAHFENADDFVASEQRAVAVVWRDPFRTTDSIGNLTYESFIQFFLWDTGF